MKKIVLALGMLLMLSCSTDDAATLNVVEETPDKPEQPSVPINTCGVTYREIHTVNMRGFVDTLSDETRNYTSLQYAPNYINNIGYLQNISCGEKKTDTKTIAEYKFTLIRRTY